VTSAPRSRCCWSMRRSSSVDVVAGEDEDVTRLLGTDGIDVLVSSVGVPWYQDFETRCMGGRISNELASSLATTGPSLADVTVERERLVLGEDVA